MSESSKVGSRTLTSVSSATWPRASRRWRRSSGRSRSWPAPGLRRQDRASCSSSPRKVGEASREAARLAKADQASELVREFPDLEGHIGAEYARLVGYPEAVCAAIDEQYLPDSADGPLPQTEPGRVIAAAEKVDNLTVAFALGQRPTGSRDPHGLRRAAIGLCRLAVEGAGSRDRRWRTRRPRPCAAGRAAGRGHGRSVRRCRLRARAAGGRARRAGRVRARRARRLRHRPGRRRRACARPRGGASSDEFDRAFVAFDRSNRLAGKADGAADSLDASLATDDAEVALIEALGNASPRIDAAMSERDFEGAIAAAAELGPPIDRFFDDVLVMVDDVSVRANRLRLLPGRSRRRRRARRPVADSALMDEPVELHVVSDSTGETAARVVEAVEAQFPDRSSRSSAIRGSPLPRTCTSLRRGPADAALSCSSRSSSRSSVKRCARSASATGFITATCSDTRSRRWRACPARRRPGSPVRGACSTRATSSASPRSSSPCATTTAPAPTSSPRPTWSWSASRAARRRPSRCISPTSGTRPPTCPS